jgi:hypothetical protein
MSKECLLQWSIVMVVVILMSGIAEGSPDLQQLQPDSSLGRWFDRQAAMSNERSIQPELADDQVSFFPVCFCNLPRFRIFIFVGL